MQIAVFSGSFNPVHNGHIAVANAALADGSDEVWLIVSPQNPHKREEDLWPFEARMKLAELAATNLPGIKVSGCENSLPRPSYTIRTLEFLKKTYPENQFRLLIGEDNLVRFHLWKDYKLILDSFGLIVYPRSTGKNEHLKHFPNSYRMNAPLLHVSSSEIRQRLSDNASIHDLVPPQVEAYILEKFGTRDHTSGF
jgi:nicotinate-nucleotide adenylyltransferase